MDKTMELVLVAMVLMVASVIIIAMANTQIGGFGDSIKDQRNDVEGNLSEELNNIPDSETDYEGPERKFEVPNSNSQSNHVVEA